MKIEPTYCTFEQAKLLKEKGFDVPIYSVYYLDAIPPSITTRVSSLEGTLSGCELSAPEQWQVIEWLRIKHNLFIQLGRDEDNWECSIYDISCGNRHIPNGFKTYASP